MSPTNGVSFWIISGCGELWIIQIVGVDNTRIGIPSKDVSLHIGNQDWTNRTYTIPGRIPSELE